jgi:DNA-binding transcriptional ArsR family regulator
MRVVEAAIRAIAERHRREIVRLVRDEELTAGQIAAHFEVSRPAVSQHLRILKDTGLVTERRQGTRRYYRARVEGLTALREFLEVFLGEESWTTARPPAPVGDTIDVDGSRQGEVIPR